MEHQILIILQHHLHFLKTLEQNSPNLRKRKAYKNKSVKGTDIPAKKDRFTIQVISKKRLADAQQYANKLIKSGYDAYIQKAYFKETEEVWYRVRIGSYDNYNSAQAVASVVSKDIKLSVWVDFVRVDN